MLHKASSLLQRHTALAGGYTGIWGLLDRRGTGDHAVCRGWQRSYQQQTSWPLVLEHSDVVVLWSANPLIR
ncbi:hypothetical protein ACNKHM_13620 [Shigella sonnei]